MAYKLVFLQTAKEDLDKIFDYLLQVTCSVSSAQKVINDIFETTDYLIDFPYIGTDISQLLNRNDKKHFRKLTILPSNYLIFYHVEEDINSVFIDHIRKANQDWINLFQNY